MREPAVGHGLEADDHGRCDWDEREARWWDALMRGRAVLTFAEVIHRPAWQVRSACRDLSPEAFFPETPAAEMEAKAVCGRCPVSVECLAHAIERDIRYGIWGGLAARERRAEPNAPVEQPLALRRSRSHLRAV